MTRPPVKRTRRHITLRLTPDQAKALSRSLHGLPAPARHLNKLKELADQASELADQDPSPKPNRTSVPPGRGLTLRKGGPI